MTLLKEMVENLINEDNTNAKVNFHSYLTTKMKSITEMESTGSHILKLDSFLSKHENKKARMAWLKIIKDNKAADGWDHLETKKVLAAIATGEDIIDQHDLDFK